MIRVTQQPNNDWTSVDKSTDFAVGPMPQRKTAMKIVEEKSQVVGFRLQTTLARDVKVEAGSRGLKLNELFAEMWANYKKAKPKGQK